MKHGCLVVFNIIIYNKVNFLIYYKKCLQGTFGCEIYGMLGSLFGVTSIWTMVFIALDRYNVIVKVK